LLGDIAFTGIATWQSAPVTALGELIAQDLIDWTSVVHSADSLGKLFEVDIIHMDIIG